jgi:cobalamin biosynthesis protein CobT
MKITEKNINRLKEAFVKKHSLKEGIIDYIFGKVLVKKLSNDKNFVSMAKRLDKDLQELRDEVERLKANGEPIPLSYKNLLNIKD